MLTLIVLIVSFAAGYWAGASDHPTAQRVRGFVGRWWTP